MEKNLESWNLYMAVWKWNWSKKKKTETLKETSQNNDASEMKTESIVFDNAHFM